MLPDLRGSIQRGGAVSGNIHFRRRVLRQRNYFQKFSRDDG